MTLAEKLAEASAIELYQSLDSIPGALKQLSDTLARSTGHKNAFLANATGAPGSDRVDG